MVRLVDIASAVGVHPSTVSRVLNGETGHSLRPETVERILAEARARGYRPNALARALRQHHTGALTFVVPMLRNPIWVRLQRGALLRAAERGYVVMIMEEPTEDPKPPGAYSYLVTESRADGLLLATALRSAAERAGPAGAADEALERGAARVRQPARSRPGQRRRHGRGGRRPAVPRPRGRPWPPQRAAHRRAA